MISSNLVLHNKRVMAHILLKKLNIVINATTFDDIMHQINNTYIMHSKHYETGKAKNLQANHRFIPLFEINPNNN